MKTTGMQANRRAGRQGRQRIAHGPFQFQPAAVQGHRHTRPVAAPQAGHDHADEAGIASLQIFRTDAEEGVAGWNWNGPWAIL